MPTLAVHGTADGTVPIAHSQLLVDKVPGAQLLSIPGAGHLAIATHSEIAVKGVLDFLQARAPARNASAAPLRNG